MLSAIPFDPVEHSLEVEQIVMRGNARKYYRFRHADFYGPNGIITADGLGCNLLCAYCWNYIKNQNPETAKSLGFMSPSDVSKRLQSLAIRHSCDKFRISGCEPFLGQASTLHISSILKSMPSDSDFLIESNGLMLGFDPALIKHLEGLDNILIRIAVKGSDPLTWSKITGAQGSYQGYQIKAIKALRAKGLSVSVAIMPKFVNTELLGLGFGEDYDLEDLTYYGGTKSRLIERGLIDKPPKLMPKPTCNPSAIDFWDGQGDIT
jgi:uncharacterized Fe-S cluster-containing radical SAM superfamily protein